jgi:hypothetical protein
MVANEPGAMRLVKLAPFWTAVTVTAVWPKIPVATSRAMGGRRFT